MRDPDQSETEPLRQELAAVLRRIAELEQVNDDLPVPAELEHLRVHGGTGWVTLPDGSDVLVAVDAEHLCGATATEIYRHLAAYADRRVTGRVGPVERCELPRPLAGYVRERSSVVLADWLGQHTRTVLRELRRGWVARHSQRSLWGIAVLPALLAARVVRELSAAASTLTPAAASVSAVTAPLAATAVIVTSPVIWPSVDAASRPVHVDAVVAPAADTVEMPPWPMPRSPLAPDTAPEDVDAEPEEPEVCPVPLEVAPAPSPTPVPAPLVSPSATPPVAPSATPSATETPTPTTAPTTSSPSSPPTSSPTSSEPAAAPEPTPESSATSSPEPMSAPSAGLAPSPVTPSATPSLRAHRPSARPRHVRPTRDVPRARKTGRKSPHHKHGRLHGLG